MPTQCEIALMINIHKKGSKDECKNYKRNDPIGYCIKLHVNILKNRLVLIVEGILDDG
jgi:hypothetical protein